MLKQRFDALEPQRQGAVVAGASLALFLTGAVFGWLRRRSVEAAAAENAAARDAYVQLQGQAAAGKLASLSFTAQAERCVPSASRTAQQLHFSHATSFCAQREPAFEAQGRARRRRE